MLLLEDVFQDIAYIMTEEDRAIWLSKPYKRYAVQHELDSVLFQKEHVHASVASKIEAVDSYPGLNTTTARY